MADSPTRNQCAVTNLHFLHHALNANAAARHHQSVQDEAATGLAVDRQPFGTIPVLLVQVYDRTAAIGGPDLQALSAFELDIQRIGINAVVGNLDDGISRFVLAPFGPRLFYAVERPALKDWIKVKEFSQ